jgi:hypothetical protein
MDQSHDTAHRNEGHAQVEPKPWVMLKQRNSMTPICQLPEELLVHVLHILQTKEGAKYFLDTPSSWPCDHHDFTWVRATWVCSHIRNIAICASKLWPWVDYSKSKEWNALTVSRAGKAALNVDMPLFERNDEELIAETATAPYLVQAERARFDFSKKRNARDIVAGLAFAQAESATDTMFERDTRNQDPSHSRQPIGSATTVRNENSDVARVDVAQSSSYGAHQSYIVKEYNISRLSSGRNDSARSITR